MKKFAYSKDLLSRELSGVPPGGLATQVLTKNSGSDFDMGWAPGSGGDGLTIVAAENIPAFAPVTSNGKIADSANPSQSLGKVIGVAAAAINTGFSGAVIESGELTNPGWAWTAGDVIFINGTSLSKTPPATGFVQIVGTAKAPTVIVVELGQPFTF